VIETAARSPVRDVVVERLLDLLRSGALKPGDRLPPEPELMQLAGVGRSTVREAVRTLASMQLVDVRHGHGTFVRDSTAQALTDPQMLVYLRDHRVAQDLMEARRTLEPEIALLAAARCTPEDARAMQDAMQRWSTGRGADSRTPEWRAAHLDFHEALARATHNVVLIRMWASAATFLRDSPLVRPTTPPSRPTDWLARKGPLHHALYDAVVAHDPPRAVRAMHAHLDDMLTTMQALVAPKPTKPTKPKSQRRR
jgi:GntR family transcriptional repressor for pyruvate dehydrogenase complex